MTSRPASCGPLWSQVACNPPGAGPCHCLASPQRTGRVFAGLASLPPPFTAFCSATEYALIVVSIDDSPAPVDPLPPGTTAFDKVLIDVYAH
jgi:hypothetical protein